MNIIPTNVAALLDAEAARINSPAFIAEDPVQFPRRFSEIHDVEITALLSAIIAWGNRKMICRDAERMLEIMRQEPWTFVREGAYEDIDSDRNIHRTFFGRHLQYFLRGLHRIYKRYPSLDAFAAEKRVGEGECCSWQLVDRMQREMQEANGGECCSRCLPLNLKTTALKRVNMALRWLVRDDGIVDMGLWKSIPKSRLYIPLDVHAGNTARALGLLSRKANDRKATEELTLTLRTINAADPCLYDYALFGLGIEGAIKPDVAQTE